MNKGISYFISGILVGAMLATAGFSLYLRGQKVSGGHSSQLVLKLGHSLDTGHPVHKAMVYMKERLEELSSGSVTIDIYPSSVLGSETQCIEQLQNGSLAMTKTSAAAMENFIPAMSVFAQVETPEHPEIEVRRGALKRALANLVENAVIHGGRAEIAVRLTRRQAEFAVDDDGPGIPEDRRDEALRPFTRLDEARNQDAASGTGLGLSIALDIARSHGGALVLDDSARLGGLRAVLSIPR